jgi:Alpha/beta hydrolase domain
MLTRLTGLTLLAATIAVPEVYRIHVKERTDLDNGAASGSAGPYERITATAYFRLDPKLEQNRRIVDLDLAPVNEDGFVEFSADLLVLKPRDPAKGNGTALIDVPNRGRILSMAMFNRARSSLDPQTGDDLGDRFLMKQGFTIVSVGWQVDTPQIPGRLGLRAPKLPGITGIVRAEFVPDQKLKQFSLGDRDHVPYPVADEGWAGNRLYVSDGPGKPRKEVPRGEWRFVNKTAVEVETGCLPGKIYEVVYQATGAVPVGLGFASIRDVASFLKHGESPFLLGDQRSHIRRTIAFGVSQTGRFLRHMLYQGFNQDEKKRMALDGVWSHVAGAGRGGFNHRFAQPSRDGQPLLHYSWPVDLFPFTDTETRDSLTGKQDGLLTRVKKSNAVPKIIYTNNSYEYWGREAALIHTTPDGKQDVAPDANTRIYFLAGGQHGAGSLPVTRRNTANLTNPFDYRYAMRALLLALDSWLEDGVAPPESAYPRIAAGELAKPNAVKYPKPISPPQFPRLARVLDFGPEFLTKGIVAVEPPKEGAAYPLLVPQVDGDGNEVGGLRLPEISVPLGVYTGWNLRSEAIGSPDQMIAFTGSFFPYQRSEIAKRYGDKNGYLKRVRQVSQELSKKRLVLDSDVEELVSHAGKVWDAVQALPESRN